MTCARAIVDAKVGVVSRTGLLFVLDHNIVYDVALRILTFECGSPVFPSAETLAVTVMTTWSPFFMVV
jgi:hypothetical protein